MYLVDVAARLATQKHAKARSERSSCTDLVLEKLYLLVTCVPILPSLGVAPDDLVRQRNKISFTSSSDCDEAQDLPFYESASQRDRPRQFDSLIRGSTKVLIIDEHPRQVFRTTSGPSS